MKVNRWLLFVWCLTGLASAACAQTYDQLWKQVDQAWQKSLPETIVRLTDEIYQKGEREKNSAQMLKAYMRRMQTRQELAPDSLFVHLKGLEQWAACAEKPMDRMVLHSLMADFYADYATAHWWQLLHRTEVVGEPLPDDIREWTLNRFVERVRMHTREALSDSALLVKTSSREYIPFVEWGNASSYFHHTMYHLLASRAIASWRKLVRADDGGGTGETGSYTVRGELERLYRNVLLSCRAAGENEGELLTMLEYLAWKYSLEAVRPAGAGSRDTASSDDIYIKELEELKLRFGHSPLCAEIFLAQAKYEQRLERRAEALKQCDEAIAHYPLYFRINALKNFRQQLIYPHLRVTLNEQAYPEQDLTLRVEHANLDGFTACLYTAGNGRRQRLVATQHYALTRPADYQVTDTTFTLKAPTTGDYILRIVPDTRANKNHEAKLRVSRLYVLVFPLPNGRYRITVLEAQNGHPVPQAKVTLHNGEGKLLNELLTDNDGCAELPWSSDYNYVKLTATKEGGYGTTQQSFYSRNRSYATTREEMESVTLLTDRSVYRPGQTVYVKGVAYTQQSDQAHVLADKAYTVSLSDVNGQTVGEQTVRTNEFGSFTTDFTLPSACLNGLFSLKAGKGQTSIRVEEYKRPTFEIMLEGPKEGYRSGDSVQVKGTVRSYSGVPSQALSVKYIVKRSAYGFWRSADVRQVASGETVTDDEGRFSVPVSLTAAGEGDNAKGVFCRYTVEVTVLNVVGETQTAVEVIPVGEEPLSLYINLPATNCKDAPLQATFAVDNLSRQPIEVEGSFFLYPVREEASEEGEDAPVATGTFVSNRKTELDWKDLPSGAYRLKAVVKDAQGRSAEQTNEVVLFSSEDRRPPVKTVKWVYRKRMEFDAARPALFDVGTSEKEVYVMMDVFCGNKLVERRTMMLSDTVVHFSYPYKEEYGNGVVVGLCIVRDGVPHTEQFELNKPLPQDTLSMKWNVFRDKLHPGQQEEWTLTIKTPQGQAAAAELLATMYDASLDKIWKRSTDFRIYRYRSHPYLTWEYGFGRQSHLSYMWPVDYKKVLPLVYDRFAQSDGVRGMWNLSGGLCGAVTDGRMMKMRGTRSLTVTTEEAMPSALMSAQTDAVKSANGTAKMTVSAAYDAGAGESLPDATPDLRTDFSETAFFYPQLRTNADGEVVIAFTLPESLTRWNFVGYAHTKNMMTGTLTGEAVASKDFMLTPHLPRFLRTGDKASVAASVVNMTGQAQAGTVCMTLFDPVTEKVIAVQKQHFAAEAGQTVGVNFSFAVSDKYSMMGCRIVADSGGFSDGEQQLIPVLDNKEHLTETLPLSVREEGTHVFSLDGLFNRHSKSATRRTLTVEFTAHPAWYALQALPSLALPEGDNAVSWATAYYANALASFIVNSQPRVKTLFDSWKRQDDAKETFLSNLQKNPEVKNLLLAETPWVFEAQSEQQQKERLATLFDLNNISNNTITVLTKLQGLQRADGAWSWYKGMEGSRYMTTYIAKMNARLALLTDRRPSGAASALQEKALAYLHQSALKEYQEILRRRKTGEKEVGVSEDILQYLYILAISGKPVPAANKAAYAYYLSKVEELLLPSSVNTKAIAAVVLYKAGRVKEAQAFVASLKEHLTKSKEQGMFFAFNAEPYSWGGTGIQTHVNAMEALELVGGSSEEVEEMKLWLLKQKQTQQWNSPVATADAVYALLMRGTDLLEERGDVKIQVGGEVWKTSDADKTMVPGVGYTKRSYTGKEVVDARRIEVTKETPGIAWGAVYATFDIPMDDLQEQGGALSVQKQLYVERTVGNRPQLQPVKKNTSLRIGDKVVSRLIVKTDRAMDFVQLKDRRGACFEPTDNVSGYRSVNGTGCYVDVKDASTHFFFHHLKKGVCVLEHSYRVSRSGTYQTGSAVVQCAYAPEYAAHSASSTVTVAE